MNKHVSLYVDSDVSINPGTEPIMYTLYALLTIFPQNKKRVAENQKCILVNKHVDSHVDSYVGINPGVEPIMYTLYTLWRTFPQNEKSIAGNQKCILVNKYVDSHVSINAGAEPACILCKEYGYFSQSENHPEERKDDA